LWYNSTNVSHQAKIRDKETNNEREAAMLIMHKVVEKEGLTWKRVDQELSDRMCGDWYDPGRVIDISYLADDT